MSTKDVGNLGEDLACEYLVDKGYKILGRNYELNFGEIDIVAKKKGFFADKVIHFIEVKALSHSGGVFFPEERVNYKKQQKYKKLSEVWLLKNKISEGTPYQVDIIAISGKNIDFFENVVRDS